MSDRVCLMNHGRIEQIGTPTDLYFRPTTVFAADFLGESNILPARLIGATAGNAVLECPAAGGMILAASDGAGPPGDRRIMVRPENLCLVTRAEPGWNAAAAVVKDVIFTGATTRTVVELSDGTTLLATELTVESGLSSGPGRSLVVQWRPEHTVLLPGTA